MGSEGKAASAPEGAILTSHGETIAGLDRLLKDGAPRRRVAAGRRPVLDQPVQTGTLQPPRDVRLGATRGVGFRAGGQGVLSTLRGRRQGCLRGAVGGHKLCFANAVDHEAAGNLVGTAVGRLQANPLEGLGMARRAHLRHMGCVGCGAGSWRFSVNLTTALSQRHALWL